MSGDYYDYQRELRRLQRHRETFINNIEVAKILPTLCESEAFTKRDETEVINSIRYFQGVISSFPMSRASRNYFFLSFSM